MICRLFVFVLAATFFACSSGQTAFNRGNFDLAVQKAAQRLQQRPGLSKRGHALATNVLQQAFLQAYEQHQTTIRQLSSPSNNSAFRWERVFQEYERLQALTDNARRGFAHRGFDRRGFAHRGTAPGCDSCVTWLNQYPTSYQTQQQDIRALAAADRYEAAEQAFAYRDDDRLAAKDAYLNYQKAIHWVPDYRQARAKAADALPLALLRVLIEPLSPSRELSNGETRELGDQLLRQISQQPVPSEFVRLYPPNALERPLVDIPDAPLLVEGYPVHQAVQMIVTDYVPYSESNSSSSTTVYSAMEYKVGEKKINDSTKVDVKEKVKGTLTTYQREIRAELTLRMRAIDTQTGKVLWEDPVGESRSWKTEWQTFSGDDRALNGQTLKSADAFPPSRWRLYDSMRDELASDVARRLQNRYIRD